MENTVSVCLSPQFSKANQLVCLGGELTAAFSEFLFWKYPGYVLKKMKITFFIPCAILKFIVFKHLLFNQL